ncbi:Similar to RTase: Probable RNA-directed DNA polymerase from transposon BS (Drosophila melanogaster) [Cotesia congregata]|uniref:Similar to RTase: Probable RNA-directed DNA polymerase from transposon BS (Drosophila melanogaster) n=1 Tax=Cotesia congregata TaxID=51543 RepID=A0A8J2MHV0_COTCN|nr:Similar to RTase: Probable RNA-directed DNA polymerase from transposon BS (Drosophila melanogaster) [Cotesia congregata]
MAINANCLQHNVRRFELFSRIEQYNPDIVLISETKLTKNHYIQSHDYTVIRTDRPNSKQGGGTAIMIKNNIKHQIIKYPTSEKNELLEFTIVQLLPSQHLEKKTFIISAYATNSNRKIFIQELNDVLQRLNLHNQNHFFILAGDLNARRKEWGDSKDNQRGKYLRTWEEESADKFGASIYTTDEPSFTAGTFLDVCITNITLSSLTANNKITTADYDSDHRALLFSAILPSELQKETVIQSPRRNLRAIKWKKFGKVLDDEYKQDLPDNRNLSIQEIDEGIQKITSAIATTMSKTAPVVKRDEGILKYLNSRIKKLQKNKTESIKLLHMLSKSTNPHKQVAITKLKSTINLIKAELRIEFNKAVEEYWRGQIKQINHKDPTAFFPKINKLLRKKNLISIADQKINNDDPACLNGSIDISKATPVDNELIITDPTDKLNVIGDFYQSINAPRYLNTGTRLKEIVDSKASAAKELLKTRRDVSITITNFSSENSAINPTHSGFIIPNVLNNTKKDAPDEHKKEQPFINITQTFSVWDGVNTSKKSYKILEGLQQGTVNSPLLFNIYTMALLQSFGLNKSENLFAVAYADDIITGIVGKNPAKLQEDLETLVNKINNYYKTWNLRMNPEKCETAVFRRESNHLSKKALSQIDEFKIKSKNYLLLTTRQTNINICNPNLVEYQRSCYGKLQGLREEMSQGMHWYLQISSF